MDQARSIENEFLDVPHSKLTQFSKNDSTKSNSQFLSKKPSFTNSIYGIDKSLSNSQKAKHPKVRSTSKNGVSKPIFNAPQKDAKETTTNSQSYMSVISSLTFQQQSSLNKPQRDSRKSITSFRPISQAKKTRIVNVGKSENQVKEQTPLLSASGKPPKDKISPLTNPQKLIKKQHTFETAPKQIQKQLTQDSEPLETALTEKDINGGHDFIPRNKA